MTETVNFNFKAIIHMNKIIKFTSYRNDCNHDDAADNLPADRTENCLADIHSVHNSWWNPEANE